MGEAGWWVWPGSHLLAEEIEAIWMTEVLPRVEHLRHSGKSEIRCQAVPSHVYPCPPRLSHENQL